MFQYILKCLGSFTIVQPIDECFGCQKRMGEISTIYGSQEEQFKKK
jgi:hypothetical protein